MPYLAGQKLKATDLASASGYAEYRSSVTQAIGNGVDVDCAYDTAVSASSLVTRAPTATGHQFTLERSGLWGIFVVERFQALANGERSFKLTSNTTRFAGAGDVGSSAAAYTVTFGRVMPFAENDVIVCVAYQSSGGSATRDASAGERWATISLCWLGG